MLTAIQVMYNVLIQKNAITKYTNDLDFLVFLGHAKSADEMAGNANLRSERTKTDIVKAIGEMSNDWIVYDIIIISISSESESLALNKFTFYLNYRSYKLMNIGLYIFAGKTILADIMSELKASPVYSIIIDETCDVTMREQLIIYAKYLNKESVTKTSFLGIVQVLSVENTTTEMI